MNRARKTEQLHETIAQH